MSNGSRGFRLDVNLKKDKCKFERDNLAGMRVRGNLALGGSLRGITSRVRGERGVTSHSFLILALLGERKRSNCVFVF